MGGLVGGSSTVGSEGGASVDCASAAVGLAKTCTVGWASSAEAGMLPTREATKRIQKVRAPNL